MKILKTLGTIGSIVVLIGAIFKVMHYPGANVLISIGSLFLFIYLLSWLFESIKESTTSKEKMFNLLLTLTLLVNFVGALFKVMHYPAAGAPFVPILLVMMILLVVFYLMYISSEPDANKKSATTKFMIVYVALTGYYLVKGGQPNHIMTGFSFPDEAINTMTQKISDKNATLYQKLENDSLNKEKAQKIKTMSDELAKYISDLKIEIITTASKDQNLVQENVRIIDLMCRYDYDTPSMILLGEDSDNATGKAPELKNKLTSYRESLLSLFDGASKEMLNNSIGLQTNGCDMEDAQTLSWEQCNFEHKPVGAVMMVFDQMKNEIRYAESIALQQLMMK